MVTGPTIWGLPIKEVASFSKLWFTFLTISSILANGASLGILISTVETMLLRLKLRTTVIDRLGIKLRVPSELVIWVVRKPSEVTDPLMLSISTTSPTSICCSIRIKKPLTTSATKPCAPSPRAILKIPAPAISVPTGTPSISRRPESQKKRQV